MAQSALEAELVRKLERLKSSLSAHDRGVILGLMLSVLPIFPVAFFGLLISLVNYWLWKSGRLDIFEKGAIRTGMVLGAINTIIGLAALIFLLKYILGVDWSLIGETLYDKLLHVPNLILRPGSGRAVINL